MITRSRAALAAFITCILLAPSGAHAELARFIQVIKNEAGDTRFHLGELEAFANGVVPDDAGGGSFGGLTTSNNDIGNGTLVTYGDGNLLPQIGTMAQLEHGGANKNPNNAMESGGAVWSTANGQGTFAQYTLDLGGTHDVTTVRMWPRADGCCDNRWRNLEVNLYADDGTGAPGVLVVSSDDARLAAPGGNVPLELAFFPGSTAIETLAFTPVFTYPEDDDSAILSSALPGAVVGTVRALNEFGGPIPSATFSLVAGAGDTNNGLYEFDGSNELQVTGDLSGLDGVEHSVRVRGSSDEGDVDMAFTFTVILDSDSDDLPDSWELMFGTLADFETGGDFDGDGDNDEDEFKEGTDPSVPHGALLLEKFNVDDGGFTQEATGNSPIDSVYNSGRGTWSMHGDDSGPATNTLTSPPIPVPTTGGIKVSFDHRYSIEADWDGTALQVSIDGGPFRTVPHALFTQNGYTFFGLIGNHVLGGQDGFNGVSPGYGAGEFITSIAEVGGVRAGGTITLRFLGAWDEGARGPGTPNWEIDSVRVELLPDQDGDGMPDSYEVANGLDETVNDAAGDPDMDDVSNLDEFLAGTDPNDADSDDDGLPDGVETGTGVFLSASDTGTDPRNPDSDGDGLDDGVEDPTLPFVDANQPGTDPNDADTDGDSFSDGIEITLGSDPTRADSIPPTGTGVLVGTVDVILGPDDLNLDPTVVIAVSVNGDADRVVNGVTFQTDGQGGNQGTATNGDVSVTTSATHQINNWAGAPAFVGADATSVANLSEIMRDIRWEAAPNPLTVDIEGLAPGALYEIQLLFNEGADRNRHWDIGVEGELVVDNITSEGHADPGGGVWTPNNSARYTGEFAAPPDGILNIAMQQHIGGQGQMGSDNNPILQAVIVRLSDQRPFAISEFSFDGVEATVTWNSNPGLTYALDSSTDLLTWIEIDDGIESQGDLTSFTDIPSPPGVTRYYYRVRKLE